MMRSLTLATWSVGCGASERRRKRPWRPAAAGQQRCASRAVVRANVRRPATAGARKDRHAEKGQAPEADQRRGLRQRQRFGQRVAECIPGKAGQHMTAQPFARRQRSGKRDHPRGIPGPDQPRQREAEGGVTAQDRPAGRARRTAAASRRSAHRPGRRIRSSTVRRRNSRSRTTSRPSRPLERRASVRRPRRRSARP